LSRGRIFSKSPKIKVKNMLCLEFLCLDILYYNNNWLGQQFYDNFCDDVLSDLFKSLKINTCYCCD
jgi:hypothetical protein